MLTRLRVQGFKSLLDVEVFFGPFTCFIGPNAAGKSNIFDAIRFLSLLAEYPIMDAVARVRESNGRRIDPRTLFTLFGDFVAPEIRIEADLVIGHSVEDDFGVKAATTKSPLRYVVAFHLDDNETPNQLRMVEESLQPIPQDEARKGMGFNKSKPFAADCVFGRRSTPYISTDQESGEINFGLHQDLRRGRLLRFPGGRTQRTTLQSVNTSEYPTALAAKKEMLSWRTLMLEPSAMRTPSSYHDSDRIDTRGANLPAAVHRLEKTEEQTGQVAATLANRLADLIEDVRQIRVVNDTTTETLTLEAMDIGGVYHAARSLSDGTLRFLTLSILSIDPLAEGVICLEEPENGIHPERIEAMVDLLRDIAVDPTLSIDSDNPLRQVVLNSHSPDVVHVCSPQEIVFVSTVETSQNGARGQVTTTYVPAVSWRNERPRQLSLALGQLHPYFGTKWPSDELQLWLSLADNDE